MENGEDTGGPEPEDQEVEVGAEDATTTSSSSGVPLPEERMDSNGRSLEPGQFYLSIGYDDSETGFATHYIPISSTDFNSIVINDQELGNIYFNEEVEQFPQAAEHTYHTYSTNSPTTAVFQSAGGSPADEDSGNTNATSISAYFSQSIRRISKGTMKMKGRKATKDETKLWDSNRTLTLLQLMREHEPTFKQQVSRQRIEVWESIADEMRKFGYVDATKLTCAKKWYNIRKKYMELSRREEKNWYCYKQVKYLIPVMRKRKELPFTPIQLPGTLASESGPRKESLKFVKAFEDAVAAQKQELLDRLEVFRAEKEVLNQEQERYLKEITISLQKRSQQLRYQESVAAQNISSSSTAALITSTDENDMQNLLPNDVEMVELVDGENIITTTSTDGEQIQLTVCLDWDQVRL